MIWLVSFALACSSVGLGPNAKKADAAAPRGYRNYFLHPPTKNNYYQVSTPKGIHIHL